MKTGAKPPPSGGGAVISRAHLPNRRTAESITVEHDHQRFDVTFGRSPDGQLREIFMASTKPSRGIDDHARDAAIAASLALQFGCPLETLLAALGRDDAGRPVSPLGAALANLEPGDTP